MHHRPVPRAEETLFDRVVEVGHQRRVETGDVEQAERLGVQPELRPGRDLDELLERPEAAGQRDETVGEVGHHRLALVHRPDHAQLGDLRVTDLARDGASGMIPITVPPAFMAVSATTFISPTLPPPKTTSIPRATNTRASAPRVAVYSGRTPTFDPA